MTSELSDLIWGRLGLSAVRAVPLEEPRAPSAKTAVTELRPRGAAWTRELPLCVPRARAVPWARALAVAQP